MKRSILLLVGFLASIATISANNRANNMNLESVSFSIGTYPVISTGEYVGDGYSSADDESWLPSFNIAYNYQFKRWFSFGAVVSYTNYRYSSVSEVSNSTEHHIAIMPMANFHWFTSPTNQFSLYSSAGAGVSNVFFSDSGRIVRDENSWCALCGQVNFIGFRAGNRLFGFGELGYGTLGIMRFGLGYKF